MSQLISFLALNQKFLLFHFVGRNLKLRYRRSVLGYLWTLLVPIASASIYYFLFKVIFKVQIPDFAAFVVTGILIWSFFSGTLGEGMESLLANFSLLLQVNVPLNIFPIATTLSNLLTLLFSLPVVFGICLISGVQIGWSSVLIFFYIGLLAIQTYCLSYMLSVLVIYIRDLKQVMGLVMQVWMYGTPILYQSNLIPPQYFWVLYANPVGKIFTGIHNCLMRGLWPTPAELAVPVLWTLAIFIATFYMHGRVSKLALERI